MKKWGIDVPQDILITQVKNFMEAYEKKDVLMLADTMKYEIYEALCYYKEILSRAYAFGRKFINEKIYEGKTN